MMAVKQLIEVGFEWILGHRTEKPIVLDLHTSQAMVHGASKCATCERRSGEEKESAFSQHHPHVLVRALQWNSSPAAFPLHRAAAASHRQLPSTHSGTDAMLV